MTTLHFEIISVLTYLTESKAIVLSMEINEREYAESLAKGFKCESFDVGAMDDGNTQVTFIGGDHSSAMATFLYNRKA